MNPERAVIGLATVFDAPDTNDGTVWRGAQFADFAAADMGVEMRDEHRTPMDAAERLGTWRSFAVLTSGSTPAGLLALGDFGHSPHAEARLSVLRESFEAFDPWRERAQWGLSVKAADVSDRHDGSRMWLSEVSLTTKPAHTDARVLGVGQYALDVWELLTGRKPPTVVAFTARTVQRRLRGAVNGRLVYDEWTE